MIKTEVHGDILTTNDRHIIFALDTQGFNDRGFAFYVSKKYWPELATMGPKKLGEVLTKTVGNKTFYAIVCHDLQVKNGWKQAPEIIEKAINSMTFPEGENASIVAIGTGIIADLTGAPKAEIHEALKKCTKMLNLYVAKRTY